MPEVVQLIARLGERLGFESALEVPASESAWVDVVWFDPRLSFQSFPGRAPIRWKPVLPVVGFEAEIGTGASAKHIKGSVANLSNLGAQLGVIVIGEASIGRHAKFKGFATWSRGKLEKHVMQKVYRWVYAEAQPGVRVVLMSEREVREWAKRAGVGAVEGAV